MPNLSPPSDKSYNIVNEIKNNDLKESIIKLWLISVISATNNLNVFRILKATIRANIQNYQYKNSPHLSCKYLIL